jgi:hypothetical protein
MLEEVADVDKNFAAAMSEIGSSVQKFLPH